MNKEVNFEIAKLLEKKGFSEKTLQAYVYRGVEHQDSSYKGRLTKDKLLCDISAPTIAEVVMWLYEKHGIWIYIRQGYKWEWYIETVANHPELKYNDGLEDSPTEAYEEAIIYTLENLIQGGNNE